MNSGEWSSTSVGAGLATGTEAAEEEEEEAAAVVEDRDADDVKEGVAAESAAAVAGGMWGAVSVTEAVVAIGAAVGSGTVG